MGCWIGTVPRPSTSLPWPSPSLTSAHTQLSPYVSHTTAKLSYKPCNSNLTPRKQPTLDSKEDQNSVGKCPVADSTVQAQKAKVAAAIPPDHPLHSTLRLCLFDGFLLYSPAVAAIQPSLDIKLFLRASYAKAKARREARDGYATIEGFWADPPGYVDMIVWPNYVKEHAWMFEGGDVEGKFNEDVLDKEGIKVQKEADIDGDISKTLEWTVDTILEELKHRV